MLRKRRHRWMCLVERAIIRQGIEARSRCYITLKFRRRRNGEGEEGWQGWLGDQHFKIELFLIMPASSVIRDTTGGERSAGR